jgi:rhombotail lipoprotein
MQISTKRSFRSFVLLAATACAIQALGGCATIHERHNAASVVDFLYPNTKDPVVAPGIPVLTLPLRVGIAFVPSAGYGSPVLTETRRMDLMRQVADHFKKYPYVKDIELIPSAYLKPKGGFANLEQIRTMYGVDVMALVSYDQIQFTDQGLLSLTYWTIVGAYIVPGEKNDTHTMLDTVVVDINSHKMLFRAPGTNHVKGSSTPVNLSEQLRLDSEASFGEAAKQMIENLDQQLAMFKDKVKERPDEYKVVRTAEYQSRGGGGFDAAWIALVALLGGGFVWQRKRS